LKAKRKKDEVREAAKDHFEANKVRGGRREENKGGEGEDGSYFTLGATRHEGDYEESHAESYWARYWNCHNEARGKSAKLR